MYEKLKRNIGKECKNIYIFFFFLMQKKSETSKDIKAEYKANPLKKKKTGKEEFTVSLSIPNTAKNPKVKTQISIEKKNYMPFNIWFKPRS